MSCLSSKHLREGKGERRKGGNQGQESVRRDKFLHVIWSLRSLRDVILISRRSSVVFPDSHATQDIVLVIVLSACLRLQTLLCRSVDPFVMPSHTSQIFPVYPILFKSKKKNMKGKKSEKKRNINGKKSRKVKMNEKKRKIG